MRIRLSSGAPVALVALALAAGCLGDGATGPEIPRLVLRSASDTWQTAVGQSITARVMLVDAKGNGVTTPENVQWSVADTSIATVGGAGWAATVTGRKVGRTVLTGRLNSQSASDTITVVPYEWPIAMIEPQVALLAPGVSRQLLGTNANPPRGNLSDPLQQLYRPFTGVTWTSSDRAVATVDAQGIVTGVAAGSATISAVHPSRTFTSRVYVAAYPAPLRFRQLAVGSGHACGLTGDGSAYCWGLDAGGRLGTKDSVDLLSSWTPPWIASYGFSYARRAAVPVRVQIPEPVTSIAARDFSSCGVTAAGRLYCWGDGLSGVAEVSRGIAFNATDGECAVSQSQAAYCWASTDSTTSAPTLVAGGMRWRTVSGGSNHRCGLAGDSTLFCWMQGQTPTAVAPSMRFSAVHATMRGTAKHACALSTDGRVYCWSDAEESGSAALVAVSDVQFRSMSATTWATCAIALDRFSYCWGTMNQFGAYNTPPLVVTTPTRMGPDVSLSSLAIGGDHAGRTFEFGMTLCGIGTDGVTYCRGNNRNGNLGSGDFNETTDTKRVVGQ